MKMSSVHEWSGGFFSLGPKLQTVNPMKTTNTKSYEKNWFVLHAVLANVQPFYGRKKLSYECEKLILAMWMFVCVESLFCQYEWVIFPIILLRWTVSYQGGIYFTNMNIILPIWAPTLVIWMLVQLYTVEPYTDLAWVANSTICVSLQLVTSPILSADSL